MIKHICMLASDKTLGIRKENYKITNFEKNLNKEQSLNIL